MANSVDPDQTASLGSDRIWVYTVCLDLYILRLLQLSAAILAAGEAVLLHSNKQIMWPDQELDNAQKKDGKKRCMKWNEPPHDKTNRMACAPSEDSDQPGHPPSLISTQRRLRSAWAFAQSDQSSLSASRKLWSLATHWSQSEWAEAQADLLGAVILLVSSWGGSNYDKETAFAHNIGK